MTYSLGACWEAKADMVRPGAAQCTRNKVLFRTRYPDSHLSCACREAKEDIVVLGYRIPKGTPLMLGPYAMHMSPQNFLQPYDFLPSRWTGVSEAVTPVISKGMTDAVAHGEYR